MVKLSLALFLLLLAGSANAQPQTTTNDTPQRISAYSLPPERHQQAHELNRIYFRYRVISFFFTLLVLGLILYSKLAVKFRDLAERVSSRSFVQSLIFTPLLVATVSFIELPADAYIHRVSTQYGLSIQSWPAWFSDWSKQLLLTTIAATLLVWLLYAIIRKSPRRWWVYFWLASLPIALFLVFIQPLVIDPIFDKFEPLAAKDPVLASSLSRMAQRAGEDIPVERMFWMQASEKTTTLNAYVTGFGASKRIVVWDTTIAKLNTPQVVFVAGHEMGHYVLHHVAKGLLLSALGSLLLFYAGYLIIGRLISSSVRRWGVRGVDDYASLPALLLVTVTLVFICNPVVNATSRYFEHQADQYALEITHSLTPDSGQVGAQTFRVMGYVGLSDPDPGPINVFMFYDHPTISDRVQFCLAYDPWSSGASPAFVTP
jgi:Zn-dependent protease with chaperone function